jgi:hypothetical protein
VKVNPDFEVLFKLMDGLRADTKRRYSNIELSIEVNACDNGEDMGHTVKEVKIALPLSVNTLTRVEEHVR